MALGKRALPAQSPAELRVHGVGDHGAWSSMGTPRAIVKGGDAGPSVVAAPRTPDHSVFLFNWSRVTRRTFRSLWYLAFPYTLLNAAFQMRPKTLWRSRVHAVAIHGASATMTVLTAVWTLRVGENVPLILGQDEVAGLTPMPVWLAAFGTLLSGVILWRSRQSGEFANRVGVVHAVLVACTTTLVIWLRPARIVLDPDGWLMPYASRGLGPEGIQAMTTYFGGRPGPNDHLELELTPYLDFTSLISWCSLLLAVLFVGLLFLACFGQGEEEAPLVGSALCVTLSFLIGGLSLSALAGQLPSLLNQLLRPFHRDLRTWPQTLLIPWGGTSRAGAVLATVFAIELFLLVVAILVVALFKPLKNVSDKTQRFQPALWRLRRGTSAFARRRIRLSWAHRLISGHLLGALLGGQILFWLVTEYFGWWLQHQVLRAIFRDEGFVIRYNGDYLIPQVEDAVWFDRFLPVFTGGVVAFGFWILKSGAAGPLRGTLGKIGDVAGFWPVTASPLGAQTYRPRVVKALREFVIAQGTDNIVVVGHSQGSVLAAWMLANASEGTDLGSPRLPHDPNAIRGLVTCGCPLISLYARFFPHAFDEAFFDRVRAATSVWVNCWRSTDPIATKLPKADVNYEFPDPRKQDALPLGHSDYWLDRQQIEAVRQIVEGVRPNTGPVDTQ